MPASISAWKSGLNKMGQPVDRHFVPGARDLTMLPLKPLKFRITGTDTLGLVAVGFAASSLGIPASSALSSLGYEGADAQCRRASQCVIGKRLVSNSGTRIFFTLVSFTLTKWCPFHNRTTPDMARLGQSSEVVLADVGSIARPQSSRTSGTVDPGILICLLCELPWGGNRQYLLGWRRGSGCSELWGGHTRLEVMWTASGRNRKGKYCQCASREHVPRLYPVTWQPYRRSGSPLMLGP